MLHLEVKTYRKKENVKYITSNNADWAHSHEEEEINKMVEPRQSTVRINNEEETVSAIGQSHVTLNICA